MHIDLAADEEHIQLPRQRLSGHVAEYIKQQIESRSLQPGDRINELELTKRLGVSRSPVREAILHLAGQGFVEIRPHRGAFVRAVDDRILREIAEVRALLESAIARYLAEQRDESAAAVERLVDTVGQMRAAVDAEDRDTVARLHFDFHSSLVDATPNSVLRGMLRDLSEQTRMFITLGHRDFMRGDLIDVVGQHASLLDAIRSGDGSRAERAYRDHILFLRQR